jgi:hypothetical protein
MGTAVPSLGAEKTPAWVCTACGSDGGQPVGGGVFGAFAQLDARYTEGYCDVCSVANPSKPRKTPRPTNQLIRADLFDHEAFVIRKEKEKLGKLVRLVASGGSNIQLTDAECYTIVTLFGKYGWPGYEPSESIVKGAAKYSTPPPADKKTKRAKNKAKGW